LEFCERVKECGGVKEAPGIRPAWAKKKQMEKKVSIQNSGKKKGAKKREKKNLGQELCNGGIRLGRTGKTTG